MEITALQLLVHRLQLVARAVDELLQRDAQPLLARDLHDSLCTRFAFLSGGRSRDGSPILIFPEFLQFKEIPEEEFRNVLTYLTGIPSLRDSENGFSVIIDRRRDRWAAVKAALTRIATFFPADLRLVLVLRPAAFLQRHISELGVRLSRDDFKMKVPLIMLNSVSDLCDYIDSEELSAELGGTREYSHRRWVQQRTAIEDFALTVKATAQLLQTFGADLAEMELPQDVPSTRALLGAHAGKRCQLKDEMQMAVEEGNGLMASIEDCSDSDSSGDSDSERAENISTVQRLLTQLYETEAAFDEFWEKHHLKLQQCLDIRHFQEEFTEVAVALGELTHRLAEVPDLAESRSHAERVLRELASLQQRGQEWLGKAAMLASRGEELIEADNLFAEDALALPCQELQRISLEFSEGHERKSRSLGLSLELEKRLEKAMAWCERGVYLLASQPVDRCQSQEGAEAALAEIHAFLESSHEHQLGDTSPFDAILTSDLSERVEVLHRKVTEVRDMFEKRRQGLRKLAAKQARPVQHVAPRPESPRHSPKSSQGAVRRGVDKQACAETDPAKKKGLKKMKSTPKIEVVHDESQGGSPMAVAGSDSEENTVTRRRHIMNELMETERAYVEELLCIIEGYANHFEDPEMECLIPAQLRNKTEALFGNLPEIYSFHNSVFLRELEAYVDQPELIGRCFLQRKEDFQIYEKYCQNKPRSEAVWRQFADAAFFQECQRRLDHKLALDSYLLKPVQRITKYQLLLKEMLKCSKNSAGTQELEEALAGMLSILKAVNDSMHQIAITGFEGDVRDLGRLLMQGAFSVWAESRKGHSKVKELARFKPMQRHLFLYPKLLLFCKRREETGEGYEKAPSYSFKHALKMDGVGITEVAKGDQKKFEVSYNGREEVYTIQASSVEVKTAWVHEIRKVLTSQLEACKEASQLQQRITDISFQSPMSTGTPSSPLRNQRKSGWSRVKSHSELVTIRNSNDGKNARASDRTALDNASKRFTIPSARAPRDSQIDLSGVNRRYSAAPALGCSPKRQPSGKEPPASPAKAKRHEVKSDPTPLGYRAAEPLISALDKAKCFSTGNLSPTSHIQPGDWLPKPAPTVDNNEDYDAGWSSADELINSSEAEDEQSTSQYTAPGDYEAQTAEEITLKKGEGIILLKEDSEGYWLVRSSVSLREGLVPGSHFKSPGVDSKSCQSLSSSGEGFPHSDVDATGSSRSADVDGTTSVYCAAVDLTTLGPNRQLDIRTGLFISLKVRKSNFRN
ncbi:guanine nucleotide exchange factor DBS-like [Lampetra planeri]